MRFEVLVATMHQADTSLIKKMNIQSDVVIANQADGYSFQQTINGDKSVKMITTPSRGVGLNRNLALLMATADILLFADDDVVYADGYAQSIKNAFLEIPDADVIIFGMELTKNGAVFKTVKNPIRRVHPVNSMKYGTCVMAVRRNSIQKANICFSTLFGGGCRYGSGEDSLFLLECFRKKLRVYTHSYVLGKCAKDESSWFQGYNEKYFYDKGAWLECAFPKSKHILKYYFWWRFRSFSNMPDRSIIRQMEAGMQGYRLGQPFVCG